MFNTNSSGSNHQPGNPDDGQFDLFAQRSDWTPDSPAGKFETFHEANPQVWDCLVREARRWRADGRGKLGINLLIGRVRWVLTVQTNTGGDGFKINDHTSPFYARLLMHRCPDLDGLFELRRAYDADKWIDDIKGTGSRAA